MVTWKRTYWVLWAVYTAAVFFWFPPWETEWNEAWIPLGIAAMIAVWGFGSEFLGRKLGVGEARFDPETGKLLGEETQP